jgi:hypothetical protein
VPRVPNRGTPFAFYRPQYIFQEAKLNFAIPVMLISLIAAPAAFAQKLVDPTTVAPEYREAAEKRRAEQIKQQNCARKADLEKVMPRDRTTFLVHCLEADAGN